MNDDYIISTENLLRALPDVLRNDKEMYALASSIAMQLSARLDEIDALRIYTRIDDLPEEILDILAYDFKIDWWDANYTIKQKRRTLKDGLNSHRYLGTKGSLVTALSSVFPGIRVEEWFEYGGDPYLFRILINADEIDGVRDWKKSMTRIVELNKNIRSHLEPIILFVDDFKINNYHEIRTIRTINRALLIHPPRPFTAGTAYRIALSPFNTSLPITYSGAYHYDGAITWAGFGENAPYPFPARTVSAVLNHNSFKFSVPASGSITHLLSNNKHEARSVIQAGRVTQSAELTATLRTTGTIAYNDAYRYDGTAYWDGKTAKYKL